jgi:flagellar hook-associated protein FlgK
MRREYGAIAASFQFDSNAADPGHMALDRRREAGRMTSAINSALAGLRAAETRVGVRAQNIVNVLTEDYEPLVPVQTNGEGGGPVVKVTKSELSGDFPQVDLATELVDMNVAKTAYAASAKIIRTLEEMDKTLLDTFA